MSDIYLITMGFCLFNLIFFLLPAEGNLSPIKLLFGWKRIERKKELKRQYIINRWHQNVGDWVSVSHCRLPQT